MLFYFFFINDTATTDIYTFPYTTLFRSRPGIDSLPCPPPTAHKPPPTDQNSSHLVELDRPALRGGDHGGFEHALGLVGVGEVDRKSTRLNSSHGYISYAVFCLKKKITID